jgi:hypothetical protein
MHLMIDLARDFAIVAIELVVLISLGWCLSRNSVGDKVKFSSGRGSVEWSNRRDVKLHHQQKSDARHSSPATHRQL